MSREQTTSPAATYEQLQAIDSDTAYHPFIRAGVQRAMPEIERLRAEVKKWRDLLEECGRCQHECVWPYCQQDGVKAR